MPEKNIGVFVDVSSLHRNVKLIYDGKLDYNYYLQSIKKLGSIYRAFAYGVQRDDGARKFIDFLEIIGFETNYIPIKIGKNGKTYFIDRSGQLIIDMVRILDKLDIVVFGTNNPIIVPAITYARDRGCKTLVFACNIPREIKNVTHEWWEIKENYLEQYREENEDHEEEDELIEEETKKV